MDHRSARRHDQLHPRLPVLLRIDRARAQGRRHAGCRHDPNKNDLFTATRGRGAYLNDRRIASPPTACRTHWSAQASRSAKGRPRCLRAPLHRNDAGLHGPAPSRAAALDLANVAAGLDAFFEQGINVWDMAAGSLLITEAGGLVGNHTGDADFLHRHEIVAANPKIYAQMIPILKGYTACIRQRRSPGRACMARLARTLAGIVMTALLRLPVAGRRDNLPAQGSLRAPILKLPELYGPVSVLPLARPFPQ